MSAEAVVEKQLESIVEQRTKIETFISTAKGRPMQKILRKV